MGMLLKRRIKGFTLIESSIVLIIFCLIFTIPTLRFNSFKEELELKNTSRIVKSVIETTTRKALLNHQTYSISYFKNSNQIYIRDGNNSQSIKINPKIKIEKLNKVDISDNGVIAPRTIMVKGKNKQETVKVQMTWGRMINE